MWYEKVYFNASALINDTWYISDVPSIADSQLCLAENVVSLNNQSYKMWSYYFKLLFDLYVKRFSSRVPFETFLNSTLCQSVPWFC